MKECTCTYCYHGVCFHPIRGDGAGLGVSCDGCDFDETSQDDNAPISEENFDHQAPIMTMMFITGLRK